MAEYDTPTDTLAGRLTTLAGSIVPGAVTVSALRRLSGGAVNEMWSFDLIAADGAATPLVLRRPVGGVRTSPNAIPLPVEAGLVMLADTAGVPVARVRYRFRAEDGLGEGFVSERIDGETLGGRIVRSPMLADARDGLAFRCGEVLARIHAIDPAPLGDLPVRHPPDQVEALAAAYHATGWPRPVFALALRWLRNNLPPDRAPCLVHGDFRNGNLIVDPDGLRAVLDWEGAHIAHPMSDVGFLCVNSWRFGAIDLPVGGFGTRADFFAGYAAAGGAPDFAALHFWEVYGTLRWGVMCAGAAHGFAGKAADDVEVALIARRASETELDLLNLLDVEA